MVPKIMEPVKPFMDNLQFAYLANRCTEDAVNTLLHETSQHLDKGLNYVRCLFIDYSSAFNTMQPHILLKRLQEYHVSARLQLFILDFLTDRKQYVKTSSETSAIITCNTGGPQGCVLSAFLFIIYTNDMSSKDASVKIIKYADDTVVIGMISENDETEYRDSIEYVSNWCAENYLDLNVTKTKEMITDFRRKQNVKDPVTINGSEVDVVKTYKYLGVTIQEDLKWDSHIDNQLKKCNKRMYHVRCLKKLNIDHKIIVLFYNSVISSLLTYAISSWYSACSDKLKNDVNKPGKKVSKMLCPMYKESVIVPKFVYEKSVVP